MNIHTFGDRIPDLPAIHHEGGIMVEEGGFREKLPYGKSDFHAVEANDILVGRMSTVCRLMPYSESVVIMSVDALKALLQHKAIAEQDTIAQQINAILGQAG